MRNDDVRKTRSRVLLAAAAVGLGVTLTACSGGSKSPTVATVTTTASQSSSTAPSAGGTGSSKTTPLAEAEAFSECMRSHGAPTFPDPVVTPGGGYGYRTVGIDPNSASFQRAIQVCKDLPSPWNSSGRSLTPAQQQAWLTWAQCIRYHGVPNFPDPTFSGDAVHTSPPGGRTPTPQFRQATEACKAKLPSAGGLGG